MSVLVSQVFGQALMDSCVSQYFVCLFIIILELWQSCTEGTKKLVRRSQQATGSNGKHNEASRSV